MSKSAVRRCTQKQCWLITGQARTVPHEQLTMYVTLSRSILQLGVLWQTVRSIYDSSAFAASAPISPPRVKGNVMIRPTWLVWPKYWDFKIRIILWHMHNRCFPAIYKGIMMLPETLVSCNIHDIWHAGCH